jgi:hypothetical protein
MTTPANLYATAATSAEIVAATTADAATSATPSSDSAAGVFDPTVLPPRMLLHLLLVSVKTRLNPTEVDQFNRSAGAGSL